MTWNVDVTLAGEVYSYPTGPALTDYFVTRTAGGLYNFHLGTIWTGPPNYTQSHHLGPHHVKIVEDGAVLFDGDIPAHWWQAQWTFRPKPLIVINQPADLVRLRLAPQFGNTGNKIGVQPVRVFRGPMDNAGITLYMPTTGERPDLGAINDPGGEFMLTGNPQNMLAWALAGGSYPAKIRDEKTGKPLDGSKQDFNIYDGPGGQSGIWIDKGPAVPTGPSGGYHIFGGGWSIQQAHYCEVAYLAALAFEDPIFLADLQHAAELLHRAPRERSNPDGSAVTHGEYRGVAWAWATIFKAHAATQHFETVGKLEPALHHPSSHYQAMLDDDLKWYAAHANDDAWMAPLGLVDIGMDKFAPWQSNHVANALSLGILTKHAAWVPIYLRSIKGLIDRQSGKTGWPPAWGGYYVYVKALDGTVAKNAGEVWQYYLGHVAAFHTAADILDATIKEHDAGTATDAELLQAQNNYGNYYIEGFPSAAQFAQLAADPMAGGQVLDGAESLCALHAALVQADALDKMGAAPVRATFPDFDAAMTNSETLFRSLGGITPKTSIVLDPTKLPPVVISPPPVQPPPTQPPTENPPMADDIVSQITAAVATVKKDVAAEIAAAHARIVAIVAAAQGKTIDPAALAGPLADLQALHTQLTGDTAALPTATS